jgi:hypothetical protein
MIDRKSGCGRSFRSLENPTLFWSDNLTNVEDRKWIWTRTIPGLLPRSVHSQIWIFSWKTLWFDRKSIQFMALSTFIIHKRDTLGKSNPLDIICMAIRIWIFLSPKLYKILQKLSFIVVASESRHSILAGGNGALTRPISFWVPTPFCEMSSPAHFRHLIGKLSM